MEVSNILLVGIEASIALAGFAGVIATYQINDVTRVRRSTVAGLTMIIHSSLFGCSGMCYSLSSSNVWGQRRNGMAYK